MRFPRILVALGALLLTVLVVHGCDSKMHEDNMNPNNNSGAIGTDGNNMNTTTTTNADNLEIRVIVEKMDASEFRVQYTLTNKGSQPIYRVVPKDISYYMLIRPFRVAMGEGREYTVPIPKTVKAQDIMILFGMEHLPQNVAREDMAVPVFVELKPGCSETGTLSVRLPVQMQSYYDSFGHPDDDKRAEDEINGMIHSETGVPCVLAFAYLFREDCIFEDDGTIAYASDLKSRLAFSQPVAIRIK